MAYPSKSQSPEWIYPKIDKEWQKAITDQFNIHPVIAQVLISRGFRNFDEINSYLYAKLPDLFDPSLFPDMEKAVDRILVALKENQSILIFGDNDVDGITGTTLLVEFLRYLGVTTHFLVANRTTPGEGVLATAKAYCLHHRCSLLITVDCGVTAGVEIEELKKHNIDVIVTDHHEPTAGIPHCVATLNPKLFNSTYPNRSITGVGVAFKLAHAIANEIAEKKDPPGVKIDLKRYLDLVALGTIADMGALTSENRILVRYGIKQLKKTKRIGLIKLLDVCEVVPNAVTTMDIGSKIAPRLNSLGRIADPTKGVELLLIRDPHSAEILAKELDLNNIERQKIERKDSEDIEELIRNSPELLSQKAILLFSYKWHPGIIPIITARIAKQYNRPTLIIAIENGIGKGSLRTIPEFPLLKSLRDLSGYLLNFGGHDFAAGLTIEEKNIPEFKEKFTQLVNDALKDQDMVPKLHLDAQVKFSEINFDFIESLNLLEPFGSENPPPIFYAEATQTWPPKVVGKSHLKLYLEQGDRVLEGIGFGLAERRNEILKKNMKIKIAFTPYVNTFLNKSSIQLMIKDFQEVG